MKINPEKSKSALIFAQLVLDYFNTYGIIPTSDAELSGVPDDLQGCAHNDLTFLREMIDANPATNIRDLLEDTVRAMAHILQELKSREQLEKEAFEAEVDLLIKNATSIANTQT